MTFLRALVPGWGQIHAGRGGKGLRYFFLVAFGINGWFILPFIYDSDLLRWSLLGLGTLYWVISFADGLKGAKAVEEGPIRSPATTAHEVEEPARKQND